MKTIAVIIGMLFLVSVNYAQTTDTTKIKVGKKQITIIEENGKAEKISNLESGKNEFKIEMLELESQIDSMRRRLAEAGELRRAEIEKQIAELDAQREALNKGIEDIERQIESIHHGRGSEDREFDIDIEDDIDIDIDDECDDIIDDDDDDSDKFQGHWAGFNLGLNNFLNKDYAMSLPEEAKFMELNTSKSWAVQLNPIEYSINLFRGYSGLVTGLGIEWNSYSLEREISLVKNADGIITYTEAEEGRQYTKNKLNAVYLTAPLLWEFQIPTNRKDHRIHFSVGITGSVKIGSNTKQVYKTEGRKNKDKNKGDYQLSPLRYGAIAQVGYRSLRLFAQYSFTPLFELDKGPELYPFTVGLTLLNF